MYCSHVQTVTSSLIRCLCVVADHSDQRDVGNFKSEAEPKVQSFARRMRIDVWRLKEKVIHEDGSTLYSSGASSALQGIRSPRSSRQQVAPLPEQYSRKNVDVRVFISLCTSPSSLLWFGRPLLDGPNSFSAMSSVGMCR